MISRQVLILGVLGSILGSLVSVRAPDRFGLAAAAASSCDIQGRVLLQGRTAHAGTAIWLDGQWQAGTAGDGSFRIALANAGEESGPSGHRIEARHEGFLDARATDLSCAAGSDLALSDIQLVGGDARPDGRIDLFDLVRLGAAFGACVSDAAYLREADLNQSGCVDLFDLVLVGRNYGRSGPSDWPLPSGRFATEILPIMQAYCRGCHGDLAGLRLDSYAALMAGSSRGPVVVPGDPEASELYLRVTGRRQLVMPPGGIRLQPAEIERIRAWIEDGAPER